MRGRSFAPTLGGNLAEQSSWLQRMGAHEAQLVVKTKLYEVDQGQEFPQRRPGWLRVQESPSRERRVPVRCCRVCATRRRRRGGRGGAAIRSSPYTRVFFRVNFRGVDARVAYRSAYAARGLVLRRMQRANGRAERGGQLLLALLLRHHGCQARPPEPAPRVCGRFVNVLASRFAAFGPTKLRAARHES